jgi:membrane-associated protease RseP (regulator of RpoE activity)
MVASVRARRAVGLGLLGLALALGGAARAQQDDGPERDVLRDIRRDIQRAIREGLLDPGPIVPGQEDSLEPDPGEPLTPRSHGIGVEVRPVDRTMRAVLDLPKNQGVVVTDVAPESAADEAGLKPHDILLKLGDDPINGPSGLDERFRDRDQGPVTVQLLRGGKETTARVTPRKPSGTTRYFIGISVGTLSDALRSHLDVPKDRGVIAGDVQPDSPAAKAGIKPNDILLTVDQKPVREAADLVERIQEIKDKAAAVELLRGGKTMTVEVTPERRDLPPAADEPARPRLPRGVRPFNPGVIIGPDGRFRLAQPVPLPMGPGIPGDAASRVRTAPGRDGRPAQGAPQGGGGAPEEGREGGLMDASPSSPPFSGGRRESRGAADRVAPGDDPSYDGPRGREDAPLGPRARQSSDRIVSIGFLS